MTSLLYEVLQAHGGLERWRQFTALSTTIVTGSEFWSFKGLVQDARPRRMTVDLHRESGSVDRVGDPDWRTDFTPDRIAIGARDGTTIAERANPPAAFTGHTLTTPWDPLHRAYFNCYALWTYMTTPFLLADPELKVAEIAPVQEGDETWRGLRATFPDGLPLTAASRTSTSRATGCSAATITMLTWPAALQPRSSSLDSSRHTDCAFPLDGVPTGAAPTRARSPTP